MEIIGFIGILSLFALVGYVALMMSKPHTRKHLH